MGNLSTVKTSADSTASMGQLRARFVADLRKTNEARKKRKKKNSKVELFSEKDIQEMADSRMKNSLQSRDRQKRLGDRLKQVRKKK